MSNRFIEKSFLYLLGISLLLHAGLFAGLYYFPPVQQPPPKEPVFIDLQQMPQLKQPPQPRQLETKRRSEQQVRVPRETAPRGEAARDVEATKTPTVSPSQTAKPSGPSQAETGETTDPKAALFRKPTGKSQLNLSPSFRSLAKLESDYRRKYEKDIADGDTRFLNSDDIVFGSFLRRFESAVYGVWRYPQEAALRGIEGITPVRITFNRRGEVTNIQQLESSGARILDEEVLRTLRAIGPVGGFPKGYDKEEFHLIAFFQYGGARGRLR